MRILLAQHDPEAGSFLKKELEKRLYVVDLMISGSEALFTGLNLPYDLIILDVLLPNLDGFKVCSQLRHHGQTAPILFLTTLDDLDYRVKALDLGADDYLISPYAFRELEARVRALLRRRGPSKTVELSFIDITLNTYTHEVWRGDHEIVLTNKEYMLLHLLMRYPDETLSQTMIAEHLWNTYDDSHANIIAVYVRHLRRKLCAHGEPNVIQTRRGCGYRLKALPTRQKATLHSYVG